MFHFRCWGGTEGLPLEVKAAAISSEKSWAQGRRRGWGALQKCPVHGGDSALQAEAMLVKAGEAFLQPSLSGGPRRVSGGQVDAALVRCLRGATTSHQFQLLHQLVYIKLSNQGVCCQTELNAASFDASPCLSPPVYISQTSWQRELKVRLGIYRSDSDTGNSDSGQS